MNEPNHDNPMPPHDEDAPQDASAQVNQPAPDALDDADDAGDPQAPDELERLRAQCEELERKYLHAVADYQNLARRSSLNIIAERDETRMRMAKALITVMDHFDRALEVEAQKTSTEDLLRGVQIVRDEMLRALEQFGVERLEAEVGGEFDPNRHEALMRQSVEGLEPDLVAQQFQVGYILGDKTLRPAKVAVSE
jgi:molecular chaperone GrpE